MLVPVICAVLFFFVFYNFLNSRKHEFGVRVDKGKNALISLIVSFIVLAALWYLLIFLASRGIFSGVIGMF